MNTELRASRHASVLARWLVLLAALAGWSGAGCTSRDVPPNQCVFDSDCADGTVCVGEHCRARCSTNSDCPAGSRCRPADTAGSSACVPADAPRSCLYASDCPEGSYCTRDGVCQAQCRTDYDCQVTNPYQSCAGGLCVLACSPRTADCNATPRDGCEADLDRDPEHCGACATRCAAAPHARAACAAGACAASCDDGFADCDGDPANGCETDLSEPSHCGACGTRCEGGAALCEVRMNGGRRSFACAVDCHDPSPLHCGASCVDPRNDPRHCGECGHACEEGPNGDAVCNAGVCAVACRDLARYADCDGRAATGCEAELARDASNCGACGTSCAGGPNAHGACVSGACGVVCDAGFGNCDGAAGNGCEADLQASPATCGACGNACPAAANARPTCAAGRCGYECSPGYGDCDGEAANGCEADLRADRDHCGTCSTRCSAGAGAAASCSMGACASRCGAGLADCDADPANGCEANLQTSVAHCGACGARCAPPNATGACTAGACAVGSCAAGFADCDGDAANGCETDTRSNALHCGTCSTECRFEGAGARCSAGVCERTSCGAGLGDCDGVASNGCETTLATSASHCGGCGNACRLANAAATCASGRCAVGSCNPGFADCDGNPTNGCEVDTRVSVASCGRCGNACNATNGTATCSGGSCGIACSAGFGDCDGAAANGCETNLNTTLASCGTCGSACAPAHATGACASGRCAIGSCNAGFADCDGSAANGCEVNLGTDPAHCGACPTVCSSVNGVPSCAAGACRIACSAGYDSCDGAVANGCETNLATTVASCGACGRTCALPNATAACAAGACRVGACNAGFADCDGVPTNGCEVDTRTSAANCGRCGGACAAANAASTCAAGSCAYTCLAGYGDCDGVASNGCETALSTSVASCGRCGNACSATNGTATCAAGACGITCSAGFADCNASATDGCEVNLGTSPSHCGRCGGACSLANATAGCAAGACTVASCNAGYGDCDGAAGNGCEVPLASTNAHCGRCGSACAAGSVCSAGVCLSTCGAGLTFCSGRCVNVATDPAHCGRCGGACPTPPNAAPTCAAGACGYACLAGYGDCDGNPANGCETSLATTVASCGRCGNACNATNGTATCAGGSCGITCAAGYGDCDGSAANGCETNLNTTPSSCGRCGGACSLANATAGCAAGACTVASCSAGYGNCDGSAANGCEASLGSVTSCGACGTVCGGANGTPLCTAGRCAIACAAGYGDCNGVNADGCETNLTTSAGNCGSCGAVCSSVNGTPSCAAGACRIACASGYGDCDGAVANGCETQTSSSVSNCGACGAVCSLANATAGCAAGACTVASCRAGFGDCDRVASNGCEANLATTPAHCGACGAACALAHASAGCSSGACTVASCDPGWGNCDGLAANGCETDVNATPAHCGGCGRACALANATAGCAAGACTVASCSAGYGNCDGVASNGCETNLNTSNGSCGVCGRACAAGQVCSSGACTSVCSSPTTYCAGSCVNLSTDPSNCRTCGAACPAPPNATAVCVAGTCGGACRSGFGDCNNSMTDGCESNLGTSTSHCGACGAACAPANATGACVGGACGIGSCNASYGDCNRSPSDGCEVALLTSAANCGGCGNACSLPNATPACSAGSCAIAACNPGYQNCDMVTSNGCETNVAGDVNNCGGCRNACPSQNGSARCTSGACSLLCNAGWGDCDGSAATGCETDTNGSLAHCGGCGLACRPPNASGACSGGACRVASCVSGFLDCNGQAGDGCEVSAQTDNANCGACGRACAGGTACAAGLCVPVNDVCTSATVINLAAGTHLDVPFTVVNANHTTNAPTPCTSTGGADVFFQFTLTQTEMVYADTFGAGFDTMLFFARDGRPRGGACDSWSIFGWSGQVWCNDDATLAESSGGPGCATAGNTSQVVGQFSPGTYYLVVAGFGSAQGAGTVHVEHLPVTGSGTVFYAPQGRDNTYFGFSQALAGSSTVSTTCGGGAGPEHSVWWRSCPTTASSPLRASTCVASNNAPFDTVLDLRHASGVVGACVDDVGTAVCARSGNASIINATVPAGAGLHVITADSYVSTQTGIYDFQLNYYPPR